MSDTPIGDSVESSRETPIFNGITRRPDPRELSAQEYFTQEAERRASMEALVTDGAEPGQDAPEPTPAPTTPNKWMPSPAARLWLYGVAVAAASLLIGYGVVTTDQGGLWLSLIGALLGTANAVAARNVPRR